MNFPTENSPEGYKHAWYSKKMDDNHKSMKYLYTTQILGRDIIWRQLGYRPIYYNTQSGDKVQVTLVTTTPEPPTKHDDIIYLGLVYELVPSIKYDNKIPELEDLSQEVQENIHVQLGYDHVSDITAMGTELVDELEDNELPGLVDNF